MSDDKVEITKITELQQKEFVMDVVDKIAEVLFYWFEESTDITNDEEAAEFVSFMWDIAMLCVSSIGLKPIGTSPSGRVYAQITPVASVKELLLDKMVDNDDGTFFEDQFNDKITPHQGEVTIETDENGNLASVDLGRWEDLFLPTED